MTKNGTQLIALNSGVVETSVLGEGELIVLLPGGGRPIGDFDDLASTLSENGYRTAALNHPGIGGSSPPGDDWDLHGLANVVAEFIVSTQITQAHLVGHAFGNRVARCLAADRPELVASVILLAAGGKFPPTPDGMAGLSGGPAQGPDDIEGIERIQKAFFAPGNDPSRLLFGRGPVRTPSHAEAVRSTDIADWWEAGTTVPILVVQGLQDAVAVPANGRSLKAALGDRVELVEIEGAGHALLLEKPDEVAAAVNSFLDHHVSIQG